MLDSPGAATKRVPSQFTAEHRANLAASHVGRVLSAETKAKISAAIRGLVRSAETRERIAAAVRGKKRRPFTAETRARMSAAKRGRVVSDETRAKLRAANLGKKYSVEQRAALSAALVRRYVDRPHTATAKAKMSAAARRRIEEGRWNGPRAGRYYTRLAQLLHSHLSRQGLSLEPEVRFGPYFVDLYDRLNHVAYEADGEYWHAAKERKHPGYYARRDEYLRLTHSLEVRRFTGTQIKRLSRTASVEAAVA